MKKIFMIVVLAGLLFVWGCPPGLARACVAWKPVLPAETLPRDYHPWTRDYHPWTSSNVLRERFGR